MKQGVIVFLLLMFLNFCIAQDHKKLDSLCKLCSISVTEPEKVEALNNLANFYCSNKLYKQADSILVEQLHIAELSNNNDLILKTYFDNYITTLSSWSTKEDFERTIDFVERGIDFAKSINSYKYI